MALRLAHHYLTGCLVLTASAGALFGLWLTPGCSSLRENARWLMQEKQRHEQMDQSTRRNHRHLEEKGRIVKEVRAGRLSFHEAVERFRVMSQEMIDAGEKPIPAIDDEEVLRQYVSDWIEGRFSGKKSKPVSLVHDRRGQPAGFSLRIEGMPFVIGP